MKHKKLKTMDSKSIQELIEIIKDGNASPADRENAEYEIGWRSDTIQALLKGGDRPVFSPPNP